MEFAPDRTGRVRAHHIRTSSPAVSLVHDGFGKRPRKHYSRRAASSFSLRARASLPFSANHKRRIGKLGTGGTGAVLGALAGSGIHVAGDLMVALGGWDGGPCRLMSARGNMP